MSDSRRTHRAIKTKLKPLYPEEPQGNASAGSGQALARHLETLAFMISGIILSKSCQLPKIPIKVPGDVHPDSRVKQMSRWVPNEYITFDLLKNSSALVTYFIPIGLIRQVALMLSINVLITMM